MPDSAALCVSPKQRWVHVLTESLAVLAITPSMVWMATRDRPLNRIEKGILWGIAAGTVLVDGWLVYRFLTNKVGQ